MTIRDQDIAIDLVNQHLIYNIRLNLTSLLDNLDQGLASTFKIRIVSINDIDQGATGLDMRVRVMLDDVVAWEVHHVELYVLIVVHYFILDLGSWQEEESLMGRHLLEDDLRNTGFA